jgi:hypothetical protein
LDEYYYLADFEEMAEMRKEAIRDGHLAFLKKHKLM